MFGGIVDFDSSIFIVVNSLDLIKKGKFFFLYWDKRFSLKKKKKKKIYIY